MKFGTRAACAVGMIALAGSASANEACWTPKELEAARVRDVQTIMMVGALQCSTQGYNTSFGYDRFVTRHRAELVEYNDVLKHHFMRQAAVSTSQRDYDSFATKLANSHSIESNDMRNYCARVDSLVRASVAVRGDELATFAAEVSERPAGVGEDCGRAVVAAADAPFGPRADRERERDEDAYRVWRAPAPYDVADNVAPPPQVELAQPPMMTAEALPPRDEPARAEPVFVEPARVETASLETASLETPDRAEPQAASREQDVALRQATAALQQATLALQAAMSQRQPAAARPVASALTAPAIAGPRRATVTPSVLAPEPVVLPPAETSQFVG